MLRRRLGGGGGAKVLHAVGYAIAILEVLSLREDVHERFDGDAGIEGESACGAGAV